MTVTELATRFLTGDVEGAKTDLLESIALLPSFTQSLVKIASVHMEQGDPKKAFECFEDAITHNPNDPDIYYHRGQGEPLRRTPMIFTDNFHPIQCCSS